MTGTSQQILLTIFLLNLFSVGAVKFIHPDGEALLCRVSMKSEEYVFMNFARGFGSGDATTLQIAITNYVEGESLTLRISED